MNVLTVDHNIICLPNDSVEYIWVVFDSTYNTKLEKYVDSATFTFKIRNIDTPSKITISSPNYHTSITDYEEYIKTLNFLQKCFVKDKDNNENKEIE